MGMQGGKTTVRKVSLGDLRVNAKMGGFSLSHSSTFSPEAVGLGHQYFPAVIETG